MDIEQAFAAVPRLDSPVWGCTYCYGEEELALLGGDPALVPDALVSSFAREVPSHWDPAQYGLLWRALAPRILRALEAGPDQGFLNGLSAAGFTEWPPAEQQALRAELRALLARVISSELSAYRSEEAVFAAAQADEDLRPWLAHLDSLTGAAADAGVARLARHWAADLPEAAAIRDWLYSDALHERLNRIGDRDTLIAIAWA